AEALERLVVQLARPPAAFRLGCGQGVAPALVGGRLRGRDGRGGARRKRFQEPLVLGGEPAAIDSVHRDQGAVGPTAKDQGDDQTVAGLKAELAEPMLLEAGPVELVGQALWLTGPQSCAGDCVLEAEPSADESAGQRAGADGDEELALALE